MSPNWSIGCESCMHIFNRYCTKPSDIKNKECPKCGSNGPHITGSRLALEIMGYSDQTDSFNFLFEPQEGGNAP